MAAVVGLGVRAALVLFFFFSIRRRHTIYLRDWSSDVCSSDLITTTDISFDLLLSRVTLKSLINRAIVEYPPPRGINDSKIGRASCRERVQISVVAVSLKKKQHRSGCIIATSCGHSLNSSVPAT